MREIVLDTETTGLDPNTGDRIVEIGCLELINHVPTGQTLHHYINPERAVPQEAFEVHGLSTEFLSTYPPFAELADAIIDFLGDATLIIHNARFDMGFINAELRRCDRPELPMDRAKDTVQLARRKYPGAQVSLDALCRRFEIDNTHRTHHGALLDAELLASVYLELIGGRQPGLGLASETAGDGISPSSSEVLPVQRGYRPPRSHQPTPEETAAHRAFLEKLTEPLWLSNTVQRTGEA
ncbi:MAG: DNA polymerase III subunit epsilon [Alphaproteobacteria bacterium]|nr:DNA polymerase III subunit epsilon [Alphaproteobacteria bacterium]